MITSPIFNLPSFEPFVKNNHTIPEQKISLNSALNKSRIARKDEWYTKLPDIESECDHYVTEFRGKNILCPCDSLNSNFVKYFENNFDRLELKSLTATCFNPRGSGLKYVKQQGKEPEQSLLRLNGDWRSPEVIKLIRNTDIVVTNPPFSLFKKMLERLVHYNTHFLILGNLPTCGTRTLSNFAKSKKMRFGYFGFGAMEFELASHYTKFMRSEVNPDGTIKNYATVASICWVTDLPVHKPLGKLLTAVYDPAIHKRYDNYDAIEVSKIKHIPKDYGGVMGVPITFLVDWDPGQFKIVGFSVDTRRGLYLNGNACFSRVFIRRIQN